MSGRYEPQLVYIKGRMSFVIMAILPILPYCMILRVCFFLFVLVNSMPARAQTRRVYLLPGQGADGVLFSRLHLDHCDTFHIRYPVPLKNETFNAYAHRLAQQIDTTQPFYLVGVSFGGMNAVEMTKFLKPQKVILLSSVKCRKELPFRYKFQKVLPLYKLFPGKFYIRTTQMARYVVEPDCRPYDSLFRAMIMRKDPMFIKRSIGMIVNWDNATVPSNVVHIHGKRDHTLPARRIKNAWFLKEGSHMMVYTRADDISLLINQELSR